MKTIKSILIILFVLALTYTVKAGQPVFDKLLMIAPSQTSQAMANAADHAGALPMHGDLLFAFIAIFSLSGYLIFKK